MQLASLDYDVFQSVAYIFENDIEFINIFGRTIKLLKECSDYVHQELSSALKDQDHWYEFRKVKFPSDALAFDENSITWRLKQGLSNELMTIRTIIRKLAKIQSSLFRSAGYLKRIYKSVKNFHSGKIPLYSTVLEKAKIYLMSSIRTLFGSCNNIQELRKYSSTVLLNSSVTVVDQPASEDSNICKFEDDEQLPANFFNSRQDMQQAYLDEVEKVLYPCRGGQVYRTYLPGTLFQLILPKQSKIQQVEYPLQILPEKLKRPTRLRKHLIKYLVGGGLLAGVVLTGVRMFRSGQLQHLIKVTREVTVAEVRKHVVEPLWNLFGGFFDSLQYREGIVSRADLEQSTRALNRMLEDYAAHHQMNLGDLKSLQSHDAMQSQTSSHIGGEQAMEFLMRRYESELRSPIRGVLFGSLMTAMLIQVRGLFILYNITGAVSSDMGYLSNFGKGGTLNAHLPLQSIRRSQPVLRVVLSVPLTQHFFLYLIFSSTLSIQMQKLKVHTEAAMLATDQVTSLPEPHPCP